MNKIPTEVEANYDIFLNNDNEISVFIKERPSEPENPRLLYAGGEHALLYRNDELLIILDFLHPGVRDFLYDAEKVLISEMRDDEVFREYIVPMTIVDQLPIPDEELPKLSDPD